jgi:hypothetical protein
MEELEQRGQQVRHLRADCSQRGDALHVVCHHGQQEQRRSHHFVRDAFDRDLARRRRGRSVGSRLVSAQPQQLRLTLLRHLVAREGVGHLLELGRHVDLLPLLGLHDGLELAHG